MRKPAGCEQRPALCLLVLAVLLGSSPSAAQTLNDIAGTAGNQTRGQPAAGDEVVLQRLSDRGMQEEARSKTDARGMFLFHARFHNGTYVVRVIHQGVTYDELAVPRKNLTVAVFDSALAVPGITGGLEIIRAGTNGSFLHVSDMYEVRNQSSPPVTLVGGRTFEVYLPPKAKLASVLAAGPGKIAVAISATPVRGEPGRYFVNFPLRPGATKFAFNYDVPYNGGAAFETKHAFPFEQMVVMTPPAMTFSSRSPAFEPLATGQKDYEVRAASHLKAGEGLAFEISGPASLPPLAARTKSSTRPQLGPIPATAPFQVNRPVAPSVPQTRSHPWLAVSAAIVLAVTALLFLALRARQRMSLAARVPAHSSVKRPRLLSDLKNELLHLAADRRSGRITGEEYDSCREILAQTLKRAAAKSE